MATKTNAHTSPARTIEVAVISPASAADTRAVLPTARVTASSHTQGTVQLQYTPRPVLIPRDAATGGKQ